MSSLTKPLQYRTKTEMIYSKLREAIVSGELKPGERIVLSKLASNLGVSAIPVREAIKHLEAEGLVNVSTYSEISVSKLSEKDFRDISSIRVLLEAYATRIAAEKVTPELIEELERLLKEMEACVGENDYRRYGILNRRFHHTIYKHSGNDHLIRIIEELTDRTDRARALFAYSSDRIKESLKEHQAIVQALSSGQHERVEKIVTEHTYSTLDMFIRYSHTNLLEGDAQ